MTADRAGDRIRGGEWGSLPIERRQDLSPRRRSIGCHSNGELTDPRIEGCGATNCYG
ncbi:MAG TPA: hypothetical protein IGS17_14270 [Oscillatoriales cyanobacterium M59_W2019_021]|nr:hypothetical protein [Oscillatoriales cyanobacterium M4454_W2019_049]HIK52069.1 hypothetical protein [Oscillatoriales cyanobacterium M59_W2019_021]